MTTRQQVETAVQEGVRGNMKCIYDLLCRRVFVRESKNCIRLATVWEGVHVCVSVCVCVRMCLCPSARTQELRSIVNGGLTEKNA